ncbi:MAG TPA: hypothetical protein VLE53_02760 [Gemmatimonadaceae bacterium]|nr:hypothetical protein [Gemmatimonadaceae bacterium]
MRREAYALPVQLFRITTGLLAAAYFLRLLAEVRDFSASDGLIDHALVQAVYPETRISLFQAGTPTAPITLALVIALGATMGVVLGWRSKVCAAVALAVAASTYRWNFIVMYLDDAVVHLLLFWVLLLPMGPSSGLVALLRDPRGTLARWSTVTVPGTAVTCLKLNVALMYVIAGLWKFDSPLWRSGYGLYASLRLPVAAMPDVWGPEHVAMLRLANWMVMAAEPFMVLPLLLRPGHPLKTIGGVLFTAFHLFILVTLGLPFAMLGLLSTSIIFFGPEITARVARWTGAPAPPVLVTAPSLTRSGRLAIAFIVVLALATTRRIPVVGALNVPAYGVLWMVGVAQDYRLFNWIDRVNFDVDTEIVEVRADGVTVPVTERARYPSSFRSKLLLAYLHDIRWLRLPRKDRLRMRTSIAERLAPWYCRNNPGDATVRLTSDVFRLVPSGRRFAYRLMVAEFECRAGAARVKRTLDAASPPNGTQARAPRTTAPPRSLSSPRGTPRR